MDIETRHELALANQKLDRIEDKLNRMELLMRLGLGVEEDADTQGQCETTAPKGVPA